MTDKKVRKRAGTDRKFEEPVVDEQTVNQVRVSFLLAGRRHGSSSRGTLGAFPLPTQYTVLPLADKLSTGPKAHTNLIRFFPWLPPAFGFYSSCQETKRGVNLQPHDGNLICRRTNMRSDVSCLGCRPNEPFLISGAPCILSRLVYISS